MSESKRNGECDKMSVSELYCIPLPLGGMVINCATQCLQRYARRLAVKKTAFDSSYECLGNPISIGESQCLGSISPESEEAHNNAIAASLTYPHYTTGIMREARDVTKTPSEHSGGSQFDLLPTCES